MNMKKLAGIYRDGLLNDTIPFWIPRAIDREGGGYFNAVNRDGSIMATDKSVWLQGRFSWMLSTFCTKIEQKQEWLDLARHGIDFLDHHCFDTDGRMFFWTTRDGKPLRKRRYVFSELFTALAYAGYGLASGDKQWGHKALALFKMAHHYHSTPGLLPPKINQGTRPMKGLAMTMMLIATAQEIRKVVNDAFLTKVIDDSLADIERHFLKPEFRCLLEVVGPNGEFYDTLDGRQVNPGHSLEAGWFILDEAQYRGNDAHLVQLGCKIIDWSYEIGLDKEFGGLLYFRDAKGLPPTEYWHDMKFWWPHNEALIATLMAYQLTNDQKYLKWHENIHDWAYKNFPDREHGEWFGYLRRDGQVSTPVKGTMWKGFFHLPRMQLYCWKMLDDLANRAPKSEARNPKF